MGCRSKPQPRMIVFTVELCIWIVTYPFDPLSRKAMRFIRDQTIAWHVLDRQQTAPMELAGPRPCLQAICTSSRRHRHPVRAV